MLKKIFSTIILSVVVIIAPATNSVSAYDNFYGNNDILFYNEKANTAPCTSTGDGSIAGKVWNFFIQKGLTEMQTAGIMGNAFQESHISPTKWQKPENDLSYIKNSNSDGHAWGLFQWDQGRRYSSYTDSNGNISESGVIGSLITNKPHLVKYLDSQYSYDGAKITGSTSEGWILTDESPISDSGIPEIDLNELLTFELNYAWDEMPGRSNSLEKIKKTTTIVDATVVFHNLFEGSADSDEFVRTVRGGYAQAIYDKFSGMSSSDNCGTGNGFIDTLKKYVWPNNKGWYNTNRDAVIPTEGYKNAIIKAKEENRYTGDNCLDLGVGGGIDCGGFVTTFIKDSGWDINYNYEGYINKGAGYTATQKKWLDDNWQNLGNAASIDTSSLKLGDVAIYNMVTYDKNGDPQSSGHVFIYIGNIDGFDRNVVSASQCQRAPMAGPDPLTDSKYTWYRKK